MQKGRGRGRGRGRGGGSSNGLPRNGHFRPLLALWGRGVESPGNFFWLNPITLVPATLPNHKIVKKQPRAAANPECCHQVIVPWLRLVLAIGGFKGRTSLARLVMGELRLRSEYKCTSVKMQ